ncbi:2Fe-2S iron-sulfur cluster binding domain-containing protein [Synechococcales cyanobacterium C]|uniref:2Fe-2S iron-sulfur cluster binding domain-containing protein n=1 Tax=Petrachloros mirabilis ULC683 TaxID=2781853 RepID=A0A8K1ZYS9_9CYAN|nr:2Fe-2S iron-sulfur cluster-binding protein [Petrachloros mirabilis]NCJ06461.1 2Fe-2S iron-sulfur cluster binding domain-containing protein [Petrachloros mirabilis ULC683]
MLANSTATKVYKVTLVNEKHNLRETIRVQDDEYIFDIAEQKGLKLPVSCRAGACVSCVGRITQGEVDQDHSFLTAKELDAGFVLTCRAMPLSDCVIETHQEDALLDL